MFPFLLAGRSLQPPADAPRREPEKRHMGNASFDLTIPRSDGSAQSVSIATGESLFVLGANGTGKSSLMHRFYTTYHNRARRISAHRQTWFTSNTLELTPSGRRQTEISIRSADTRADSRWQDSHSSARSSIAIYDLVDAENVRARQIAGAVDAKNFDLAARLSATDAPTSVINELLRLSSIPIQISIQANETIVARKNQGTPYSITELSDGERNALLIAANILTVPPNTLLLIDEPERHLHRSIISPLLTQLFRQRHDCAFVVSTHDVMLPLDSTESKTLLLRACTFAGSNVQSWEADLVPPQAEVDDELKRDILGARRKMLFVEGTTGSLDQPLYSLIFPEVSVIPKATCRDVEHAVFGIRDTSSLHWLDAWGIVDNDGRTEEQIASLRERGVYALPFFAVESIYYHPEIIRRIAERVAEVTGADPEERLEFARSAAFTSLSDTHQQRLSARVAANTVREMVFQGLPTTDTIISGAPIEITIDVEAMVARERRRIEQAVTSRDLLSIVARYPVRETPALDQIARRLGFQTRREYESAVRKLLLDDQEALLLVRSFFGALVGEMESA